MTGDVRNRVLWRRRSVELLGVALCVTAHAWGEDLPQTPAEAQRLEAQNALPPSDFYKAPPHSPGKPGELLRQEPFGGYSLPQGVGAVRILYHSRNSTDQDVVSSGVVLIPAGKAPPAGWPVIAWAHGTSGVARECAPSAMRDVYYGNDLIELLKAGFAIVAADYRGLGTEGSHEYLIKKAQVDDVIYSIPAARAAVPQLGAKWVADGHSQGGFVAWGVAEREHSLRDPNYLGAVSVAAMPPGFHYLEHLNDTSDEGFFLAYIAFGIHARYQDFNPSELLLPPALERYDAVTTQDCYYSGYANYVNLRPHTLLRETAAQNAWMQQWLQANALGRAPIAAALFVIAGGKDRTAPLQFLRHTVAEACRHGGQVEFRSYPGLAHDPLMTQSIPDQVRWIRARFAGQRAGSSCPQ